MEYKNIIWEIRDEIGLIRLNRPRQYNALCQQLNLELLDVLSKIRAEGAIRVLIITGNEKAFAAGADITEMMDASPLEAKHIAGIAHEINDTLEKLEIPVIAAVGGLALGGGCELALSCDFRIAGENCVFGLPEVGLGIIPGAGGTQRLTDLIGPGRAAEVVMLGRQIKGAEAERIGLVNEVVPVEQLEARAFEIARTLCARPRVALSAAKASIQMCVKNGCGVGRQYELQHFAQLFATYDQKEGMHAFAERRQPSYQHR